MLIIRNNTPKNACNLPNANERKFMAFDNPIEAAAAAFAAPVTPFNAFVF